MNELIKYGLNKAISSDTIDKNIKRLKEGFKIDNNTLLAVLKKNDKKIKDVLLGKIIAGDYIKQKKAEIVAREKAKAEEERKKKEAVEKEKKEIEEKAAKEKVEKERKAKEQKEKEIQARTEEDRKKKESSSGNNSSPIPNPDPPDSRLPIDIPEKDFNPPLQPPAPQPKPKEPPSVSRPTPPAPSPKPEQAPDKPPKTGGGEKPGNGGGRGKSRGGGGGGGGRDPYTPIGSDIFMTSLGSEYYIDPFAGTTVNARGIEASGTYQPSGNEINKLQSIINFNITGLQSQDITLNNKSYEW